MTLTMIFRGQIVCVFFFWGLAAPDKTDADSAHSFFIVLLTLKNKVIMTTDDIFYRRAWLIDHVKSHPGIHLDQIISDWNRSPLSEKGQLQFGRSTFYADIDKIDRMFGIHIRAHLDNGSSAFFVSNSSEIFEHRLHRWLLSIISTGVKVSKCTHLYDRFLTEEFPSENGRLRPLIDAMEEGRKVNLFYKPYEKDAAIHKISPYCIKTYKHRFYVLGLSDSGHFRVFSFDRIQNIESTDECFTVSEDFDAESFFFYYYGVFITTSDEFPSDIIIRAYNDEWLYLKDVPLHHTQHLVNLGDRYADYCITIYPTNDFIGDIIQQAGRLEILSPAPQRMKVAGITRRMASQYADMPSAVS